MPSISHHADNLALTKQTLEKCFDGLQIKDIQVIGKGHDSIAYVVNKEYVFKTKFSIDKKQYQKEKEISDFLNKNLKTHIKIPQIEYSYISDELAVLGYKKILGTFLTPQNYALMSSNAQNTLKKDIADFLRKMHDLDDTPLMKYRVDDRKGMLDGCAFLQKTFLGKMTDIEKKYLDDFIKTLQLTTVFEGRKCLCHSDFGCSHLLLNEANKLAGIIDFGDSKITDEYCDFMYLLEESSEEIGPAFGEDILKLYGQIDIEKAKEYQTLNEQYYPLECILYGLKNNDQSQIDIGRAEIRSRLK